MTPLIRLVAFVVLGFVGASLLGISGLQDAEWYMFTVSALLAVGLYASTYGITLQDAREHLRIIISAVTIGVVLKAALIGGSLALLFGDPFFFVLGIAVAQIDPLSVAGLMKGKRMSSRAKTVLASWASFDDPITVILSLYAPVLIAQMFGADLQPLGGTDGAADNLFAYVRELGLNLAFAGGVLALWLLIRYYSKKTYAWLVVGLAAGVYLLLVLSFAVAVLYFMMLGIALIGLFLRPKRIEPLMERAINWALVLAAVLLGFLLVDGINIGAGLALGVAAYCAQIVAGFLLTRRLPKHDRWHIAFAQQNGITAIILALLLEPIYPGTVAVVAPAIVIINSLHAAANKILDTYVLHEKP